MVIFLVNQRAMTPKSMVQTIIEEDIIIINNVTKLHKILIKTIQLREQTLFQAVNFHIQRAITPESMVQYEPLSNLEEDIMVLKNVTINEGQ